MSLGGRASTATSMGSSGLVWALMVRWPAARTTRTTRNLALRTTPPSPKVCDVRSRVVWCLLAPYRPNARLPEVVQHEPRSDDQRAKHQQAATSSDQEIPAKIHFQRNRNHRD